MVLIVTLIGQPGDDLIGWLRFVSAVVGIVAAVLTSALKFHGWRRGNVTTRCDHELPRREKPPKRNDDDDTPQEA